MNPDDARDLEIQTLRDRLSQASLRINETLDPGRGAAASAG